jgi:hypothetical protein
MDPDGVSYLDMGDQYWSGNWHAALNAYWSPLYGWLTGLMFRLTKPSVRWEYPEVHLLNFAIFIAALISFEFFWREMLESRIANAWRGASLRYAWIVGYLLFANLYFGCAFRLSLGGDELSIVTPDLLVAALGYFLFGLVLRFAAGRLALGSSCLIGVTLGASYLAKAAMFPFGLVVIATLFAVCWRRRDGFRHAAAALLCFLAISTTFIAAISLNNHRLTFGDSGKLNIAWHVNGARPPRIHWQGLGNDTGLPQHPSRKVMDWPEVYEFATPVAGTYPVWNDPTYWWAGVNTNPNGHREVEHFLQNLKDIGLYLFLPVWMMTSVVLIVFLHSDRFKDSWRQLVAFLPILVPAAALVLMYAMVLWWPRYISWALMAGFCALIASMSVSAEEHQARILRAASMALGVMLAVVLLLNWSNSRWDRESSVQLVNAAEQLRAMGIEPGSRVAVIGDGFTEEIWARLNRVEIVAEVPRNLATGNSAAAFWSSGSAGEQAVLDVLKSTGAKAAVADMHPKVLPPGWVSVGQTGQAVYFFR